MKRPQGGNKGRDKSSPSNTERDTTDTITNTQVLHDIYRVMYI